MWQFRKRSKIGLPCNGVKDNSPPRQCLHINHLEKLLFGWTTFGGYTSPNPHPLANFDRNQRRHPSAHTSIARWRRGDRACV